VIDARCPPSRRDPRRRCGRGRGRQARTPKAHRREIIDPKINEHSGRIVNTAGDGILAEFASVVDAVRCAAEWQLAMTDRAAAIPEERRIRFRIGINLGDVIVEDDGIFGDGVNVAARLEALAEPGGICISRTVRDQIRDKLAYAFEDLGEQNVKNIARPVRAYALRPEVIADLPAAGVPVEVPRRRHTASAAIWLDEANNLPTILRELPLTPARLADDSDVAAEGPAGGAHSSGIPALRRPAK